MSDLSRLLDDVYGTGEVAPPSEPAWSSDAVLDTVFADWVPGESEGATEPERSFLDQDTFDADELGDADELVAPPEPEAPTQPEPEPQPVPSFRDADALGRSVGLVPPPEAEEPAVVPGAVASPRLDLPAWKPSDDDILPARKRFRLSLRR